jgi:ABC-type lipoprotein export system ATPase subunit
MLQGAARNLLPYLSVGDNVSFAQRAARRDRGRALPSPEDVLTMVGLHDLAGTALDRLPAGRLQLAAVAVAIASRPGLLLADEPTSQLDHRARDTVLAALAQVNQQLGTTVVLVTHDPEVAVRVPRTVTIRDGRIGGEGRRGEEYAVVTADGSLPLPAHALEDLPPGTLVKLHRDPDGYRLIVGTDDRREQP